LNPAQRIQGNLNKLRNYNQTSDIFKQFNLKGKEFSLEDLIKKVDPNSLSGNAKEYLLDIISLQAFGKVPHRERVEQVLMKEGRLVFENLATRDAFLNFLNSPDGFLRKSLIRT
jgi:hypothetical protein